MFVFDQLHRLGWQLCARRFRLDRYWNGDLLFKKHRLLLLVETRDGKRLGMDAPKAARITADMLGISAANNHRTLYYSYMCRQTGRIRGIHRWDVSEHIPTVFV